MKPTGTQTFTRRISLAKTGEGRTMPDRKRTFEDAARRASAESARSNSPCYIPHRADGGFVVFDHRPAGTVAVAHQNGVLEC